MTDFICEKYDVEQPEETMTFGKTKHTVFDLAASNVFFLGLRGSGKSTLGKKVAEHLHAPFVDTDALVQKEAGKSIRDIVGTRGWDDFRRMEAFVLEDVCTSKGQIIATGGGIILSEHNRRVIQENGTSFYIMGNPPLLARRIEQDKAGTDMRPPLGDKPLQEEISELLWEREPLYMMVAAHTLQGEKAVDELVKDVLTALWPEKEKEQIGNNEPDPFLE